MTSKLNKFFERITQCMQINTSNSAMLENGLDFSGGNSTPQFKFDSEDVESFKQPLDIFADNDLMYNDKVTVNDAEVNEYNSTENAANNIPLLSD